MSHVQYKVNVHPLTTSSLPLQELDFDLCLGISKSSGTLKTTLLTSLFKPAACRLSRTFSRFFTLLYMVFLRFRNHSLHYR